jgi:tetratricopeptide (TPR) repeat protein
MWNPFKKKSPQPSVDNPLPDRALELSEGIHERINALCRDGDELANRGDYPLALEQYWAAWDALPESKTDWEAATWILGAIGDANCLGGDFVAGRDNLSMAMRCPNAIGNAFLHLRLGQCQFELGDLDRAADELARAYMGAGSDIFEGAEKYFDFLKTRLEPPPSGW